jgi:hypothetical protein
MITSHFQSAPWSIEPMFRAISVKTFQVGWTLVVSILKSVVYSFNPMKPLVRLLVIFGRLLLILFLFFYLLPQRWQALICSIIDEPRQLPDFPPLLQVFNIDLLLYFLIQIVLEVSRQVWKLYGRLIDAVSLVVEGLLTRRLGAVVHHECLHTAEFRVWSEILFRVHCWYVIVRVVD